MTDVFGGGFDASLFARPVLDESMASGLAGRSVASWMRWAGTWTTGTAYKLHDVVLDGEWLMVCTTDEPLGTYERAAPIPTGLPTNVYNGTIGSAQDTVKQITAGQAYTWPEPGYVSGVRVDTIAGNEYRVLGVLGGTNGQDGQVTDYGSFTAEATGWTDVPVISSTPVTVGTEFALLVTIAEPDPTPTEVPASYNYFTPNNLGVPTAGQALHANDDTSTIRFSKTDSDGTDREALLLALDVGDVISTVDGDWSVQKVTDATGYVGISVAPAAQQGADGVKVFTFQTTTPTPVTYGVDAGAWAGNADVTGLLAIDGGLEDVVATDDQYGIDIKYQAAIVPTQWDLMALSGRSPSGGSGTAQIMSTPYVFHHQKVADVLDIGETWTPLTNLSEFVPAGTYMVGNSMLWNLTSAAASATFRFRINGGAWTESSREPKDAGDTNADYYAFPYEMASAGTLTIEAEIHRDGASGQLDVLYIDTFMQQVKG